MRTATADLVLQAARTLLAHHAAGRVCDPKAIEWARQILKANGVTA